MASRFSVYFYLIKMQYLSQLEYRGVMNFQFMAKIFGFGSTYVITWLMFHSFKSINGWTLYEVFFLQSLLGVVYPLSSCLFKNSVDFLPQKIATGEFDAVLTKPVNSLLYYMFRVFSTGYISNILIGVSMLVFAWIKLGLGFGFAKIGFLLLVISGGVLIQSAIYIIAAVPNFWIIKGEALTDLVIYSSAEFCDYPLSIFKRPIQILVTFLVPYAFISFYPAQYFLAKNDFLFFSPVVQYLTPLVGIVLFLGAYGLWQAGINHYESSGS